MSAPVTARASLLHDRVFGSLARCLQPGIQAAIVLTCKIQRPHRLAAYIGVAPDIAGGIVGDVPLGKRIGRPVVNVPKADLTGRFRTKPGKFGDHLPT